MKKLIHNVCKVIFSLLLLLPTIGMLNIFPLPTRDMYNTDLAFNFIMMLIDVGYINVIMGIVSLVSLVLLWTKREALAGLLLLPITVNIFAFHAFIDGGMFTSGAIMGNTFFALNVYFVWRNRESYTQLIRSV